MYLLDDQCMFYWRKWNASVVMEETSKRERERERDVRILIMIKYILSGSLETSEREPSEREPNTNQKHTTYLIRKHTGGKKTKQRRLHYEKK